MKVTLSILLALISAILIQQSPAWAYTAQVGNRAANFRGFDVVHREAIELDDYLGQWVFIEFWATWCGPCMEDLPKMMQITKPYVDRGELAVITINADNKFTIDEFHKALLELDITYPVIHDGGVYDDDFLLPIVCSEWNTTAFPSAFLIDPQGVIVANNTRGKDLGQILEFYICQDRPVMAVNGYVEVHEDGTSATIHTNVMNQGREDVKLRLSSYLTKLEWDENNVVCGSEDLEITPVAVTATLRFDCFSETTHDFVISNDQPWDTLSFALFLSVPGAEHIKDHKDRGYELYFDGKEYRLIELKRVGYEWVVVNPEP